MYDTRVKSSSRRDIVDGLVGIVLLPAVDTFVAGPPDPPVSILSLAPPEPAYWPTTGWRMASPASQGMDGTKLEVLVRLIREQALPIDSVTVVRHGYVMLDVAFPPFGLGELHELHSTTKFVTSALVGIALRGAPAVAGRTLAVDTPVLDLPAPRRVAYADERKRAMTLEHLLTMTAGLAWNESGYAYQPGTGNDLVTMFETGPDWTQYVLDRPMAQDPGTTFCYNSGASYLLSTVVSQPPNSPPRACSPRWASTRSAGRLAWRA